jgi:hypothetical protein
MVTEPRMLTDLSELPFLYEDMTPFTNRIIYYESSRGCPFRCSYCLSSIDKAVRLREQSIVQKELAVFLSHNVKQVKFVDRTFNCNKKHTLAIWSYLLAHDNGVTNFHFEIAADILDEEQLRLLKQFRPGAVQLEIGVQSTNKKTIEEIERRMDVDNVRRVVSEIRAGNNIHVHLDLIAGLPYEDYASFGRSFDEVYAMQPQQLQLGFLKVLKGSKMHDKAEEYGLVYRSSAPYEVMFTKWISFEEICRLKQVEEMVEIYYNSNQFTTTLPLLVRQFDTPFAFFEALAAYYEEKGYFVQTPARSYRYQVLLSFAAEKAASGAASGQERETLHELFTQCLTADMYLRENCKTRPAFSRELSFCKEAVRAFYQSEAESPQYLVSSYAGCDARTLARSTHIEPVDYDFATGEKLPDTKYLLFDYKNRSPLTGDAAVVAVTLPYVEVTLP